MPKVLLADDEPDLVEVVKMRLESEGYEVIVAKDGVDCLEKLEEDTPDVILLDQNMPRMNGIKTCVKIKEIPRLRHIPVILFTVTNIDEIRQRMCGMSSFDYIADPMDPADLILKIEEALKKK